MKLLKKFYWREIMPENCLKQSALLDKSDFTYSTCGPFTKNKERIERFLQTGNTDFIYKMSSIKPVFSMT